MPPSFTERQCRRWTYGSRDCVGDRMEAVFGELAIECNAAAASVPAPPATMLQFNSEQCKQRWTHEVYNRLSERDRAVIKAAMRVKSTQRCFVIVSAVVILVKAASAAQSECSQHIGDLEFDDVASLTVLSATAFDGKPIQSDGAGDDDDVVEFRVGQIYKGVELFPERQDERSVSSSSVATRIAVGTSSTQCATLLRRRRRRYIVFLNGSRTDSHKYRFVYWTVAAPVRYSRRSVKNVKRYSCSDCGTPFMTACYGRPYVHVSYVPHVGECLATDELSLLLY